MAFLKSYWWVVPLVACALPAALLQLSCGTTAVDAGAEQSVLSLDRWTYIQVDASRGKWGDWDPSLKGMKYFGLDMSDVTGDGNKDIVSGRYFYRNPGGDMTGPWKRTDFGLNVDGMLFVDVDGDQFGDCIGQALPDVYWLEAADREGTRWTPRSITQMPKTDHANGQGYEIAQIIPGGKPEILLQAGDGLYMVEIPADPQKTPWPTWRITGDNSMEGIGVADFDHDGDLDVSIALHDAAKMIVWLVNPGRAAGDWVVREVGPTDVIGDRIEAGDLDGDGDPDLVVTEESRLDGASVHWLECPENPASGRWKRHTIVTQFTTNSLDLADMDADGDIDLVAAEHRGTKKVQIWENLGHAQAWKEHVVSTDKESHLGARVADMDGDGDLEILSIAWDKHADLYLWRNDAKVKP